MDRRYQVFVSSTFDDLREERAVVINALLEMDCFPAGMELFPAADEDSLTLIKKVIDDSDYYLIVLAGRYGSYPPGDTRSFTHLEYEYAVDAGKPTIALLHSKPGSLAADKTEPSDDGKKRLDEFREVLKRKNCRTWASSAELTSAVFTGISHLKRSRPGVGWVRGSELAGEGVKDELLRLRHEIDALNKELTAAKSRAIPEGIEDLAQGSDSTTITVDFEYQETPFTDIVRWDTLMRAVLPQTFGGGVPPEAVAAAIGSLVHQKAALTGIKDDISMKWGHAILSRSDYGKVMNQMVALGLIEARQHPTIIGGTVWHATPYGIQTGSRLLAVKRSEE